MRQLVVEAKALRHNRVTAIDDLELADLALVVGNELYVELALADLRFYKGGG